MNYNYLFCVCFALLGYLNAHGQIGEVYYNDLGKCLNFDESTVHLDGKSPRESLIEDVFRTSVDMFKRLTEEQVGIYTRNLILKSHPYVSPEAYEEMKQWSISEALCKLYDWHIFSVEKKKSNEEYLRNLERELYLNSLNSGSPSWAMRVWQYDLNDNYYNIFELKRKEPNGIKANYLRIIRDEKGVMLDTFNLNAACNATPDLMLAKIRSLNLNQSLDQVEIPFFRQFENVGNIIAIETIDGKKRSIRMYYDTYAHAENERQYGHHKKIASLVELIKEFYGPDMSGIVIEEPEKEEIIDAPTDEEEPIPAEKEEAVDTEGNGR